MMYHPSHHVPALADAEDFFERVFARPSTRLSSLSRPSSSGGRSSLPDYSTFTPIADVLFDSIDPRRYLLGGRQVYATVDQPRLHAFGWYVEGIGALYSSLREHGITVVDQLGVAAAGDDPPTAAGSPMPLFFASPDSAGLRYEFLPQIPFPLDPRLDDGWTLPAVSDDDPLGIVRAACHTILTERPERALRLFVDVLGGTVVQEGRDEVLASTTTSVHVADAIIRCAVPDPDSETHARLVDRGPDDVYHSISWQVVDLDRVEQHLRSQGVGIAVRTDTRIVTEAELALGVPWEFTTAPVAGDPRN